MPTPEDTLLAQIAGLRAQVRELVGVLKRCRVELETFAPVEAAAEIEAIDAALARARDEATEGEDHG